MVDAYADVVDKTNVMVKIVDERLKWAERGARDLEGKVGRVKKGGGGGGGGGG